MLKQKLIIKIGLLYHVGFSSLFTLYSRCTVIGTENRGRISADKEGIGAEN
jgi:hypothetical protein